MLIMFRALLPLLVLAGCANVPPDPIVHQPMTAKPEAKPAGDTASRGAIFKNTASSSRALNLFEDRRPTRVGDILTVVIQENTSASTKANSSANREGKLGLSGELDTIPYFPDAFERILGVDASVSNKQEHAGKGESSASNSFSATITVTVIQQLANGNLLVSGEKQIAVNGENEFLRFSGVVNPDDIRAGNTVSSTKIADARLEHRGAGAIARAQEPGWMARFFQSVLPF
jgi:flagellar L-ring protein FlgH